MTSFHVNIPNHKIEEFKKYLASIGADYSDSEFEEDWYEFLDEKQNKEFKKI